MVRDKALRWSLITKSFCPWSWTSILIVEKNEMWVWLLVSVWDQWQRIRWLRIGQLLIYNQLFVLYILVDMTSPVSLISIFWEDADLILALAPLYWLPLGLANLSPNSLILKCLCSELGMLALLPLDILVSFLDDFIKRDVPSAWMTVGGRAE